MDNLQGIIELYEANEDLPVDEFFSSVLKKDTRFSGLNKKESIELKRQVMAYLQNEEKSILLEGYEEKHPYIKERKTDGIFKSILQYESVKKQRRWRKKYVEAFVNNITAPKSMDEMYEHYLDGNDAQMLVEDICTTGMTSWTAPRWAKRGDIVLFMHAKTAKTHLTRIRTEVRTMLHPESEKAQQLERTIAEQIAFYKKYGGKLFAIGRVYGKPQKEEVDPSLHYQSRTFCDISDLYLLDTPIDISEFNAFLKISGLCAITPVYGDCFDKLKRLISEKNSIPGYFNYSFSTPYPHSAVNKENWIKLGLEYRNAFTLELQFRQCYVDYLLKGIGDQKTIYQECACHKDNHPVTYVDNIIKIGGKFLPIEVKLNIELESNLPGQCEQYCKLDCIILEKKSGRSARMSTVVDDRVLIIDTYAIYMFYHQDKSIHYLYDLTELQSLSDLKEIREIVLANLDSGLFAD